MTQKHRGNKGKIRIVNKVRFTIFVALLLAFTIPFINRPVKGQLADTAVSSFKEVHIETGDTLWAIARANLPPKTDIRDFIHEIKEVNKLDSALIMEGDYLMIPVNP
ncbi:MAG: LysM peptidoglycan-binding domain-containing protein [Clostridiales bacterium]|nr:LysM peptidoglycan-binding domain-containing protein [Clostridiales bacterium]